MPGILVDAHVHLFPPDVAARKDEWVARDAWFGATHATWDASRFPDAPALLASMDSAGIDAAVIAAWPWHDAGLCRYHNEFLADLCASEPRLSWLGIVNPAVVGVSAEIERVAALGAVGIGELNADAQGFMWEDASQTQEMGEAAARLDLPVLAHTSEPVGHDYPGKGTATPDRLLAFIARHPDLRFVAAHWGGGLPFYELMPEVGATLQNVSYDTAASTYLYRPRVFDIVRRIVGPERILWGSDYPVLGQRRFLVQARKVVPAEATSAVFGENAVRVYGLQVPEVTQ